MIIYAAVGVIWGITSVMMQKKLYTRRIYNKEMIDLSLTFIVNGVLWPISMGWALICYMFKLGWAKDL